MAWLRIDDRVRTHPKIAKAGPAAAWLWFCGICYCREHLTDGFIPKAVVTSLAMNLPSPWKHAAKLVEVNLWEDALGGYQVHDFLDWNPSRDSVEVLREAERERKRTERGVRDVSGRTKDGLQPESSHGRAGVAGLGSGSGVDPDGSGGELGSDPDSGGFLAFWAAYPRKVARPRAERAWRKLRPDAALQGVIHAALERHRGSAQWQRDGGEFIPHPASWLNARRFEDEAPEPSAAIGFRGQGREPAMSSLGWDDECRQLHAGRCGNKHLHAAKMAEAAS